MFPIGTYLKVKHFSSRKYMVLETPSNLNHKRQIQIDSFHYVLNPEDYLLKNRTTGNVFPQRKSLVESAYTEE